MAAINPYLNFNGNTKRHLITSTGFLPEGK